VKVVESHKPFANVTFLILSLEGPDPYSHAGGLGSRVDGLSKALSKMGFDTHLFFIGDPNRPGYEVINDGTMHLHRWWQWISRYHPAGVYDGEEAKLNDWNSSLPYWMVSNIISELTSSGSELVVMAEEWQTATSVALLHDLLIKNNLRKHVRILWNANNIFGFNRVAWDVLSQAAVLTTVSRYMKHAMWNHGVDARVIPNGISATWFAPLDAKNKEQLISLFSDRAVLIKVARWDPDKRWNMAVDAVAELKRLGLRPLFLARGGIEDHQHEVTTRAEQHGLKIAYVQWNGPETKALIQAIWPSIEADVIILESYLSEQQRRALFYAGDAVLANSGIEPFGLVGLETMAVGGIAFVGSTGEDYATNGYDAISLQTNDPREIVHHLKLVKSSPNFGKKLRLNAKNSAKRYTWEAIIDRLLLPYLIEMNVDVPLSELAEAKLKQIPRPFA
jgi:glycosyltransferase involved in cell wall biosynthesis